MLSDLILCKLDGKIKPCGGNGKREPRAGDEVSIRKNIAWDDPVRFDLTVVIDGKTVLLCNSWLCHDDNPLAWHVDEAPGVLGRCKVIAVYDTTKKGERKYLLEELDHPHRRAFYREDEIAMTRFNGCGVWCKC